MTLRHMIGRFAAGVVDLVYPPCCAWCEVDLDGAARRERFCEACLRELGAAAEYRCPKCAAAVAPTFTGNDCPWCREHELRFDRAFALGRYAGPLRDAVLRLKRPGCEALAAGMVDLLWRQVGDSLAAEAVDLVVPVPMHWRRRVLRSHSDAELLAAHAARRLSRPLLRRALTRIRATRTQAGLSPPQRRENVHAAFRVRRPTVVRGKTVLLVDDILTTGATCSEAARVLKKAGAIHVAVAVLGRAQGET